MKNLILAVLAFVTVCCTGCDQDSRQNSDSILLLSFAVCGSGGEEGGILPSQNAYINDDNGELGRAIYIGTSVLGIYSSNYYIYYINWDGSFTSSSLFYSGENCSGTVYASLNNGNYSYGKSLFYGWSILYKPKTINSDGTAYYDTLNKISVSSRDDFGSCINISNSIYGIELISTDRESVGIPNSITPPLKIIFK